MHQFLSLHYRKMTNSPQLNDSLAANPYTEHLDPHKLVKQQQAVKAETQQYFTKSIVDKTSDSLVKTSKPNIAEMKRGTQSRLQQSEQQNQDQEPGPDILPPSFTQTKREGIKQFIERQRQIATVIFNTALKKAESEQLDNQLKLKKKELIEQEMQIDENLRKMEKQVSNWEVQSLQDNKQGEEVNMRLDEAKRKADELKACMNAIMQEIQRQTTILQSNIKARQMVEEVASHSAFAEKVNIFKQRRKIIGQFIQENTIKQQKVAECSDVQETKKVNNSLSYLQSLRQYNKNVPQILGSLNDKKEQQRSQSAKLAQAVDPYEILRHPIVIEISKSVCAFKGSVDNNENDALQIDFDYDGFINGLIGKLQLNQPQDTKQKSKSQIRQPQVTSQLKGDKVPSEQQSKVDTSKDSKQKDLQVQALTKDYIKEYQQELKNLKLTDDQPLPPLTTCAQNVFERLETSESHPIIQNAVQVLNESYDNPPILPFNNEKDFIENLNMLEDGNLVRTHQLQDLSSMIEKQFENMLKDGDIFMKREQLLDDQNKDKSYKADSIVKELDKQKCQENQNSFDQFIFDMSKYRTYEDLILEKLNNELELTEMAVATAGLNSGVISKEDKSLGALCILSRMELSFNNSAEALFKLSKFAKDARRDLGKKQRDLARELKSKEMLLQKERDKKRQQERDERSKKIVPIQKQPVRRYYLDEQKKTQNQIVLEQKLKQEETMANEKANDFYQEQ